MSRLLKGEDAKQGGAEAAQLSEAIESLTVKVSLINVLSLKLLIYLFLSNNAG